VSTLARQQQALLAALLEWPAQPAVQHLSGFARGVGTDTARGLKAYQANGHMLAERALRAAYPVLEQMLGAESFADLARAFWHAFPPVRGDITVWGDQLAEFLSQSAQLQGEAYLPDVARAEWALHRCASSPDRDADLATLSLLSTDDPQDLGLTLAPGLTTLSSAWPLASLMLAHLEGSPSLEAVGQQLRSPVPQDVVVWRAGFRPRLRLAMADEALLLRALQAGLALEPALEAAEGLDFAHWLPLAVQSGLVLGASRLAPSSTASGLD
jgi:hypothetical protein